jgi:hypothetical protein
MTQRTAAAAQAILVAAAVDRAALDGERFSAMMQSAAAGPLRPRGKGEGKSVMRTAVLKRLPNAAIEPSMPARRRGPSATAAFVADNAIAPALPEATMVGSVPDDHRRYGHDISRIPIGASAPASAQRKAAAKRGRGPGGIPDRLGAAIQAPGFDLSGVAVHRGSAEPARIDALAYAAGDEIHLGPGQGHHLAHEAWHLVRQRQGRVRPTMRMAGAGINDDPGLEREADIMGQKAANLQPNRMALSTPRVTGRCLTPRHPRASRSSRSG